MTVFDPISHDPLYDHAHPPHNIPVLIPSHGENMLGVLFVTQGAAPHPTILLLHGFPGNERNFDLAQILRRAGWNVLLFHYRGAWGSPGDFTFSHVLEDTHAALAYLRTLPEVDATRIVLMGHSMGAWAALMAAAADTQVLGAAALATWNVAAFVEQMPAAEQESVLAWLDSSCAPLRASGQTLFDDLQANVAGWDLRTLDFNERPLLLVAGADDEDTPDIIHHNPLVRAYASARLTHKLIANADHGFSGQRIELARTILNWLNTLT
ncbi:MAG: alpha/beta fold hydrolase [Anaerolineae bacterium]